MLIEQGPRDQPHVHPHPLPRPFPRHRPINWSYRIKSLDVGARIVDQVCETQLTQTFVNTGSVPMEVSFVFPIPQDATVDQLTFLVDGREYEGKLLPADEARAIYERHVRHNEDPALLEWVGYGMFRTSVFPLPVGGERTVTLRYTQLLKQSNNITDFLVPLATAKYTSQPLDRLAVSVAIQSAAEIRNVYSPTHAVSIERGDSRRAVVKWEGQNVTPQGDFRLMFDTSDDVLGASLLSYWPDESQDGFFVLMASPPLPTETTDVQRKSVIFVVDRSGSMSGPKMEQAKQAAKFVLNNLRDGDLFNIIAYDSTVETFRPELQRFDSTTRREAEGFVEGLFSGGSTNIDGALAAALGMVQDPAVPTYIVFLTDGLPTAGESNEMKIVENAKRLNTHHARLIAFGVGYDVNSRLLDRLARGNHGQSQYVRPDENLEQHVSQLYQSIAAPILTDLTIEYVLADADGSASPVNRVYPKETFDLFAGNQLVIVGRYRKGGLATIRIAGTINDERRQFEFPAEFARPHEGHSYAFVPRLWAARRIGELIDVMDLEGRNEELIKELIDLSTEYGIVTPYTTYLADEDAPVASLQRGGGQYGFRAAEEGLADLSEASGEGAFRQREFKNMQMAAGSGGASPGTAGHSYRLPDSGDAGQSAPADEVVRQVANGDVLYKRGNLLVAPNARDFDWEANAANVRTITRFSDEYFTLIAANTPAENQLLAAQGEGEELLVRLRGEVLLIK